MPKTLTPENLVLFVYDEISDPEMRDELKTAIRCDNDLYDEYCQMQETREMIEQTAALPSQQSINRILSYSKALNVVHTSDHHTIGLVMN